MSIINKGLFSGGLSTEQLAQLETAHIHTNKEVLDKLTESSGTLLMDGNPVNIPLDVETTQSPLNLLNNLLSFSIDNLPEL